MRKAQPTPHDVCGCGGLKSPGALACQSCVRMRQAAEALRTCEGCGVQFRKRTDTGATAGRFHSRECCFAYLARTSTQHVCRQCDAVFTWTRQGYGSRVYCSATCSERSKPWSGDFNLTRHTSWRPMSACAVCQQSIPDGSKTCSQSCRAVLMRRLLQGKTYRPAERHEYACGGCGERFSARHSRTGRCPRCAKRHLRRGKGKFRERCKRAGVPYDSSVTADKVFERDRYRCHLCGCKTPKNLRGKQLPSSPEVDHIVPITCGGGHTWDNVACACRSCNGRKSARPLGQPRLDLSRGA